MAIPVLNRRGVFDKICLSLVAVYPIVSLLFFQFYLLPRNAILMVSILMTAFLFIYCSKILFGRRLRFDDIETKYYFLFYWIVIASIAFPYIYWGQGIFVNFRISIIIFQYIYFFLLLKSRIKRRELERLITAYFLIYFVLKLIGLYYAPTKIFGAFYDASELLDDRGAYRVVVPGIGFVFLAFFMHLYKAIKNKKVVDIVLTIMASWCIVMSLTRQVIVVSFLLFMIMLILRAKRKFLLLFICAVVSVALFSYVQTTSNKMVRGMVELSEKQIENNSMGDTDIRILAAEYYLFHFNEKPLSNLLGNGPFHASSDYGKEMIKINTFKNFYLSDVGYVQIFVLYGVIGLCLFFNVFLKVAFSCKISHLQWWHYYFVFVLLTNIASQRMYASGLFVSIAYYMYVLYFKPIQTDEKPERID